MGGYGSGRHGWASPKETVESCLILSSAKLQRDKLLRAGMDAAGSLTWTRTATGEKVSSVGYEVNTLDRADAWIRLHYTQTQDKDDVDFRVRLTTTPLPWGGVRWWFVCPLVVNGRACRRRVGKLYLPPGGRYFGCRHCYDLTYTSCQESHKFDGTYRRLAAETRIPPAMVRSDLASSLALWPQKSPRGTTGSFSALWDKKEAETVGVTEKPDVSAERAKRPGGRVGRRPKAIQCLSATRIGSISLSHDQRHDPVTRRSVPADLILGIQRAGQPD